MDRLEEVILSTLEEIEEEIPKTTIEKKELEVQKTGNISLRHGKDEQKTNLLDKVIIKKKRKENDGSELLYLESLRERFLVLFEGFQAPNNILLEAKIDLTLNFLEYVLSSLDERIESLKGK